jgi:hypothetical protein
VTGYHFEAWTGRTAWPCTFKYTPSTSGLYRFTQTRWITVIVGPMSSCRCSSCCNTAKPRRAGSVLPAGELHLCTAGPHMQLAHGLQAQQHLELTAEQQLAPCDSTSDSGAAAVVNTQVLKLACITRLLSHSSSSGSLPRKSQHLLVTWCSNKAHELVT